MDILLVHNSYQQRGGEDQVFEAESRMLESHGHRVVRLHVHNDSIARQSLIRTALETIWSPSSYNTVKQLIRRERVSVVHFHNTFPLLSPSVYYAAQQPGLAVVQTLHNYRLLCPAGTFFRGSICEDCVGKLVPLPAVVHACYRGSTAASATVAVMISAHRILRTWVRKVDRFIVLSAFARQKFIDAGLPEEKIIVKPNFAADILPGDGRGGFALFVGRLCEEKGLRVLFDAWRKLTTHIPLHIAGDGPLNNEVRAAVETIPGVHWYGPANHDRIVELMQQARVLLVPSLWYEGLPMVIVEAYAAGLPVLASRLGSLPEIVKEGRTGFLFRSGDSDHLASVLTDKWGGGGMTFLNMRAGARAFYEEQYTEAANYNQLLCVYRHATESRPPYPHASLLQ